MTGNRRKKKTALWVLTVLLSAAFAVSAAAGEDYDIEDLYHLALDNTVTCDMERYPACRNFGINEIYGELTADYEANEKKLDRQYLCVAGIIKSMGPGGSSLELNDIAGGDSTLSVRIFNNEMQKKAAGFRTGDCIRVYGMAGVSRILKITVSLQPVAIEKSDLKENRSPDIYSFVSGRSFDRRKSAERSLCSGAVAFPIPETWTGVEEKISGVGMEGFMYRLNEIPTEYKTEPEQAYVFYFDNETGLRNIADQDAKAKDIEKAIIRNILDKELKEQKSVRTAAGYKFTYYLGNYRDNGGKYHNVEFIFSELDTRGVMGVLYIFNESDHKEDIIYMLQNVVKN